MLFRFPSTLAIACARPKLPLQVTAACAAIYVPALYLLTTRWGVNGAASAWVGLFAACMLILTPVVHRRLLRQPALPWYASAVLPPLLLGIGIFGAAKAAAFYAGLSGPLSYFAVASIAVGVYSAAGLMFLGVEMREFMVSMARRIARGPAPREST